LYCENDVCTTCDYDTADWSGVCYEDEPTVGGDVVGPDECTDYPESTYYECLGDDYYYYSYYGEDYISENYSDYTNEWNY
jgi:hypothetical protein